MEWKIDPDKRPINNQSQPVPQQPVSQQPIPPEPAPVAAEPTQKGPTCKLPGFEYFFKETFSVYKNNFWTFLLISAIPFVVWFFIELASLDTFILIIPIYLAVVIIYLWYSISLLYAVKERENGINIGGALAKGWSVLGSGIWVSFLSFIIIAGGFMLFIIPGIIFSIWFLLALSVLVNENKKGMAALKRSKELISGYVVAYWGRTLLFSLIFLIILLVFSFIIRFFSVSSSVLDRIANIISFIAAPLSAIFGFLVYENIKKAKDGGCTKSPREIKYILIALLLLLVPLGILASIVLVNMNSAGEKSKDIQIQVYMSQLKVATEMYTNKTADYSYGGVSCLASSDLVSICNNIKEAAGSEPTIRSSAQNYCFYVKLPKGGYYCLDNGYDYGDLGKAEVFPGSPGYCDGITFVCP
ncbi:MAG: hypothetical protein ABH813_00295 [Patescibacteria group bacterium]